MSRTYGKAQDLIDFTRASSGTALRRVKYGAELVTNGDFSDGGTGWNQLLSYDLPDFTGGVATIVATPTYIYQDLDFTAGNLYEITYDVVTAGSSMALSGSGAFGSVALATTEGTHTYRLICTNASGYFQIFFGATGLVVDNISVKEVTFDTSDGDLVLFNHPNNIPRIEYDANGNVLGLLVEESRTNLIPYSDLSTLWSLSNCTKTVNYATSPDGQSNATLFQATSNAQSYLIQSISKAASQIHYSLSVYVKKTNSRYVSLRIQGIYPSRADVIFDLDTGSISAGPAIVLNFSNATASITSAGNDWYRISLSALSDTGTLITSVIAFSQNAIVVDGTETASDSSGLMHNIQLEAGSFPTSAIPTSGSTATRSADVATIDVDAFGYNTGEGSWVAKFNTFDSNDNYVFMISDGTNSNRMLTYISAAPQSRAFSADGGVTQVNMGALVTTANTDYIQSYGYALNDIAFYTNGGSEALDTAATIPAVNIAHIGGSFSNAYLNGHMSYIKYYPRRLTNAQLQELTN